MIGKLLRAEAIKVRGRSAFTIPILAFTIFLLIMMAGMVWASRNSRGQLQTPRVWYEFSEPIAQMTVFFSMITVINLVAAEYTWRTARQNVIDGLSREQWFLGKLSLVPLVSLLFFLIGFSLITITVLFFAERTGSFITGGQLATIGGVLYSSICFSSLAAFFAFLTRTSGGAIAATLGYMTLGEGLITFALMRINPDWQIFGRYLPAQIFGALGEARQWDANAPVPRSIRVEPLDDWLLASIALAYAALLCTAAFLMVRKRDL